ncbi:HNH endonuclease [Ruania alkalisoli]|uniref:HNH endonuclease n=1 Tax=Ruania alkalisoli TaxID=2779775 RepID=A0A7M1SU16_9MICO|nr:HNH endonuclease family protein [Ruania alkalisoli]QOR71068.1 HNH endonuclease [Ruania alkalisoli]
MAGSRRRSVTVVAVALLLVAAGWVVPRWWVQVASPTPTPVPTAALESARAALPGLAVVEPLPLTEYEREFFGDPWADVDGNGCDTRNDVLGRWLTTQVRDPIVNCVVESGRLHDPYTGHVIDFRRGPSTSAAVQIDHVVALADAWRKGASHWLPGHALAFANDPANLIPVDGAANQAKGAADAAGWLPPNRGFRCAYVVQQILVKDAYGLGVSATELATLQEVLGGDCPVGASSARAAGAGHTEAVGEEVMSAARCPHCRSAPVASSHGHRVFGASQERRDARVPDRRHSRLQRHRPGDRPRVRVPAAAPPR